MLFFLQPTGVCNSSGNLALQRHSWLHFDASGISLLGCMGCFWILYGNSWPSVFLHFWILYGNVCNLLSFCTCLPLNFQIYIQSFFFFFFLLNLTCMQFHRRSQVKRLWIYIISYLYAHIANADDSIVDTTLEFRWPTNKFDLRCTWFDHVMKNLSTDVKRTKDSTGVTGCPRCMLVRVLSKRGLPRLQVY